jgi:hypothetical protein
VGNIVNIFGQSSGRLFVNSACAGASAEDAYNFPREASPLPDGSISLQWIEGKTGGNVFGSVALRRFIEEIGVPLRGNPYTKRQASNIIPSLGFLKEIHGVIYSHTNSVFAAVNSYVAGVNEGRRERAAKLAHIRVTNCSGGSIS